MFKLLLASSFFVNFAVIAALWGWKWAVAYLAVFVSVSTVHKAGRG